MIGAIQLNYNMRQDLLKTAFTGTLIGQNSFITQQDWQTQLAQ